MRGLVIPIVIATKPDGSAFGNLFFASEAPRKGVSSLSPDNVLAAEVNAFCNAEQASAERALNQGGGLSQPSWMSHLAANRHHDLPGERRTARARPADATSTFLVLSGALVAVIKTLWVPGVRKTSAGGWPKFVPSIVSAASARSLLTISVP